MKKIAAISYRVPYTRNGLAPFAQQNKRIKSLTFFLWHLIKFNSSNFSLCLLWSAVLYFYLIRSGNRSPF